MGVGALTTRSHGPCPKIMRWAYTALVLPVLAYGSIVWAHELGLKHIKDKFDKLNRLAIRHFCHAPRSTPLRLTEVMLNVMPLTLIALSKGSGRDLLSSQTNSRIWMGGSQLEENLCC